MPTEVCPICRNAGTTKQAIKSASNSFYVECSDCGKYEVGIDIFVPAQTNEVIEHNIELGAYIRDQNRKGETPLLLNLQAVKDRAHRPRAEELARTSRSNALRCSNLLSQQIRLRNSHCFDLHVASGITNERPDIL
jgi:hypothetical protein